MQRNRIRPVEWFAEQFSSGDDSSTLLGTLEDGQDGPRISASAELRYLVTQGVDLLSPAFCRVVRLYYVDGKTVAEASEALGLSVGTIKAQLARARAFGAGVALRTSM